MIMPTYWTGELIGLGDWVRVFVPRLGVWHHGIISGMSVSGSGVAVEVSHNSKDSGVTVSDWYQFAGDQLVFLARVEDNIGQPYHAFAQNCEHFASFAFTGIPESETIQTLGRIAAGVAAVSLLTAE
jgi:hypothetical protein